MPLYGDTYEPFLQAGIDSLPADLSYALYEGLPVPIGGTTSGVELASTGGYERQPHDSADWSVSGNVAESDVEFGPASGEWSGTATHWALVTDAGDVRLYGRLVRPVGVVAAQASVPVSFEIRIPDPLAD